MNRSKSRSGNRKLLQEAAERNRGGGLPIAAFFAIWCLGVGYLGLGNGALDTYSRKSSQNAQIFACSSSSWSSSPNSDPITATTTRDEDDSVPAPPGLKQARPTFLPAIGRLSLLKPGGLGSEEYRRADGQHTQSGQRSTLMISATTEFAKWLRFDTRLIFTNCGALTWHLRKAWLLQNAPELMPAADPDEAFKIQRAVRNRLAKSEYFSHIRIRARLAFAERLLYSRQPVHQAHSASSLWSSRDALASAVACDAEPAGGPMFSRPGKPRALKVADVGHQWIYFNWNWPRSSVTRLGYRIERSRTKNNGYQPVATTHACDLLLLPVNSGAAYYYRVRAFNPAGDGPPSQSILVSAL